MLGLLLKLLFWDLKLAITIMHRKNLKNSADAIEIKKKLAKEYRNKFANPYIAAERGTIDLVIRSNGNSSDDNKCIGYPI